MLSRNIQKTITIVAALAAVGPERLPARPLERLVNAADLIVAGTTNVNSELQSGRFISFTILVERVFKGQLQPGGRIQAEYEPYQSIPPGRASREFRGIWFLTRADSVWKCLPARAGQTTSIISTFYPISPGALPQGLKYDASAPLADKLILEIAAAAE